MGNRLSNENQDRTAEYAYDLVYRLTEAHYNTPGFSTNDSHSKGKGKGKSTVNANAIANQTEIYSYDPVGNRLASQKNNTYSYNAANQLVTENGSTYTYDKNGNLIQKAGSDEFASYFYNYENRLIKVERTEGASVIVANYSYDPFGRRIEKKVTENGSTTTTRFFYDNEDILFEYDENGSIGNQYVHGPGIDEPLALIQKKGNYYYHSDGLGSIVAITDESAKVVQDYDYYYFGELKNQKNRIKQPYKYTGREWDKETGLYFYRARYYDPEIGRFTQKDPIGFRGGINLYGYVGGNPLNFIDPWGLQQGPTIIFNESGEGTYGATILVMPDANTIIGTFQGSSLPNPGSYPTIKSGIYPYTTGTHHPGRPDGYPALILNNDLPIPTTGPNPNNPTGASTANLIHVHKGDTATWRGSAGCPVVEKSDWAPFISNIPFPSSGNVIILKGGTL